MAYANKPAATASKAGVQGDCAPDGHVVLGDYRKELFLEDPLQPLWASQNDLPRFLPTYVKSIEPLASPEEFRRTKKAVAEFLGPAGLGAKLQKRLKQRAKDQGGNNSWLQKWWNTYSYLGYREPNVIYVSYYYHFRDSDLPRMRRQIPRASALIRAALEFRRKVTSGILEPQTEGKRNPKPICSTAFKYMFNSCRIPRSGNDVYYMYPHDSPGCNTVLLIRKNRFFVCDITDCNGAILSTAQIESKLSQAVTCADAAVGDVVPLGALTTSNRDDWTAARAQLLEDGGGPFLDALQRTAFVVCLDDTSPSTRDSTARALWHGDGRNRWFDKSVQFVVFENGRAGLIGEHSMMDGAATLHLVNFVMDHAETTFADAVTTATNAYRPLPAAPIAPPTISSRTRWAVTNAERDFENLIRKHDLKILAFNAYGGSTIKSMKCSPDAWAQLAIQLAYFATFGEVRATYEPVSVRRFRQGRTETVRSVTRSSVEWVRAMTSNEAPTDRASYLELQRTRLKLLRDAASAHVSNIRASIAGKGCDRHLLGLRLLMRPEEKCSLFTDPMYWRSCHWHISTSALTSEHLESWGFGEVVSDGIGVGYMAKRDSLNFCVTSCHAFADTFASNLEQALLSMRRVWVDAEGPKARL